MIGRAVGVVLALGFAASTAFGQPNVRDKRDKRDDNVRDKRDRKVRDKRGPDTRDRRRPPGAVRGPVAIGGFAPKPVRRAPR